MAFAKTFNPATPVGTDLVSDVDTFITDFKQSLLERYALEHYNLTTSSPNAGNTLDTASDAQGRHIPGKVSVCYIGTTTQINALTGMVLGALAYDTTLGCFRVYNGSDWTSNVLGGGSYAFKVIQSPTYLVSPSGAKIIFTSESFDVGSCIVVGSGATQSRFIAAVDGKYQFNYSCYAPSTTGKTQLYLRKNGSNVVGSECMGFTTDSSNSSMCNGSYLLELSANDYVELWWLYETGSGKNVGATLSGFKVS